MRRPTAREVGTMAGDARIYSPSRTFRPRRNCVISPKLRDEAATRAKRGETQHRSGPAIERRSPMIEVRRLGHATLTHPDLYQQVALYTHVVDLTLLAQHANR